MHTVCTVKWDFFLLEIGEIFCNVSALNLKRGYIYFDPKINSGLYGLKYNLEDFTFTVCYF